MTGSIKQVVKLMLCLFISMPAVSFEEKPVIVAADGIIKSETEMEYRLVLFAPGKKPYLLKKFKAPVEIIWSTETEFTYIDHQGNIWQMSVSDPSEKLLLKTGYERHEDTIGKFIIKNRENKIYYVINSFPASSGHTYSLYCAFFGGKPATLFKGEGRVRAIKQLSDTIIQIVTFANTIDVDISSGKVIRSSPNTNGSRLMFFSAGYSVKDKYNADRNYAAEIFNNNRIDKPAFEYRMEKGFGIPFDFNENSRELLLVEVNVLPDKIPDRLVTIDSNGTVSEIYKSDVIGSACFLVSK